MTSERDEQPKKDELDLESEAVADLELNERDAKPVRGGECYGSVPSGWPANTCRGK